MPPKAANGKQPAKAAQVAGAKRKSSGVSGNGTVPAPPASDGTARRLTAAEQWVETTQPSLNDRLAIARIEAVGGERASKRAKPNEHGAVVQAGSKNDFSAAMDLDKLKDYAKLNQTSLQGITERFDRLRQQVQTVQQSITTVGNVEQIAQDSADTVQGVEEVAQEAVDTSVRVEELAQEAVDTSQRVEELAQDAVDTSQRVEESVVQSAEAIERVETSIIEVTDGQIMVKHLVQGVETLAQIIHGEQLRDSDTLDKIDTRVRKLVARVDTPNEIHAIRGSTYNTEIFAASFVARFNMLDASSFTNQMLVRAIDAKIDNVVEKVDEIVEKCELEGYEDMRLSVINMDETVNNIEETANSVKETVTSVQETVGSVEETVNSVQETVGNVEETVGNVAETTETIEKTVNNLEETVGELKEKINEISEKVDGMDAKMDSITATLEKADRVATARFKHSAAQLEALLRAPCDARITTRASGRRSQG
ncbi:hypothetical protein LTR17_000320 [Elasticomyces elasticus]|nr:hypothetical protein LTR17_000320 [Elasticomyces elasticus]